MKYIKELTPSEMRQYSGGAWPAVVAVYAAALAAAYYIGYYDGKQECETVE